MDLRSTFGLHMSYLSLFYLVWIVCATSPDVAIPTYSFGFCLFFAALFTLNCNLLYICLINMYGIYNLGESDKIVQYNVW